MKNLLSENMLRFGTKNLSQASKRELVLKSIMETINEHGLHTAVRRQLMEQDPQPGSGKCVSKMTITLLYDINPTTNQKNYVSSYAKFTTEAREGAYINIGDLQQLVNVQFFYNGADVVLEPTNTAQTLSGGFISGNLVLDAKKLNMLLTKPTKATGYFKVKNAAGALITANEGIECQITIAEEKRVPKTSPSGN